MKTLSLVAVLLAVPAIAAEEAVQFKTANGTLYGTLIAPASTKPRPVVLIIAGSEPTDRNGNSRMLPGANNNLKLLAEALGGHNIASLRYDKRGIGESKDAMTAEKDLRLDTYVDDAVAWANQLSKAQRFSNVIIGTARER
jgi:predicted acyl esterase